MSDAPVIDTADDLWADAERSARYHAARAAFFDTVHRWSNFAVFLSASAAAVTVGANWLSTPTYEAVFVLLPAVIAAMEAAFGISAKARMHDGLRQRFIALAGRINRDETNPKKLGEWRAELYAAYENEPAVVYYALNAACNNAVAQAIGAPKIRYQKLPGWKFVLRNVWPFHPSQFDRLDRAH